MAIHKPWWFRNDSVLVSTAQTCGLTKGGRLLPKINLESGERLQTVDPETGAQIDLIDDQLLSDMEAISRQKTTESLRFVPEGELDMRCAVPVYYNRTFVQKFKEEMSRKFSGFAVGSLAELIAKDMLIVRAGHGSPSHDQRVGEVPYIKVSDLRAGLVNINPTNRVPVSVARKFWRGDSSGLAPYDLLCPERTSKNIGDFCVLIPGQEQVVLTKEIIVLRPGKEAQFDSFYLLWAMTLQIVRDQWKRVIFMQTNREDVGDRFLEIEVPIPPSREVADHVSKAFREYYTLTAKARQGIGDYLASNGEHHFFIAGRRDFR